MGDSDNSRFDSDRTTGDYGSGNTTSGYGDSTTTTGTGYGSSNTGYGSGNTDYNDRTGQDDGKKDSTMGKLMEKAGNMLGKDNIAEKGREKREQAGRSDNY